MYSLPTSHKMLMYFKYPRVQLNEHFVAQYVMTVALFLRLQIPAEAMFVLLTKGGKENCKDQVHTHNDVSSRSHYKLGT
jgi:hypothetical protein